MIERCIEADQNVWTGCTRVAVCDVPLTMHSDVMKEVERRISGRKVHAEALAKEIQRGMELLDGWRRYQECWVNGKMLHLVMKGTLQAFLLVRAIRCAVEEYVGEIRRAKSGGDAEEEEKH